VGYGGKRAPLAAGPRGTATSPAAVPRDGKAIFIFFIFKTLSTFF
jgi:hypothetical protein